MGKDAVVIDIVMPTCCEECELYYIKKYKDYCYVTLETIEDSTKKPEWCPLKQEKLCNGCR